MDQTRNMMIEAARISRGDIHELSEYNPANFDALVFPGGNGAAKNLFTYGIDGINMTVRPDVEKVILETFKAKKPIGALCIAPVLIAKVLPGVVLTVGQVRNVIQDVESFGAQHKVTLETEVISDIENLVFTSPCYMLQASIKEIAESADHLIQEILKHI
jgi:enhancing lycopene biosynthesis protein 2